MEKILELCDSYNFNYPQHFKIFLNNCIDKYGENFVENDYLFAAVYFIILETGFFPTDFNDNSRVNDSVSFDLRNLRCVTSYTDSQIKVSNLSNKSKCYIYQIQLKLGKHNYSVCELQGVPSSEQSTYLIINFLCNEPYVVKSLCLSTEAYVVKNEDQSCYKYLLKNLNQLSVLIKNKIAIQIKDVILTNEEEGCSANLLCLPEIIQKKIIYFLKDDINSVQSLSLTCSYFNSFINKDDILWTKISNEHYSEEMIQKVWKTLDKTHPGENVSRIIFIKLWRKYGNRAKSTGRNKVS